MKKITHEIYKDYPIHPYISSKRDLKLWETNPEKFPYKIVEKKQMILLDEKILPGDLILLWRINFDNFTNESVIPQYFEYRYGVDSDNSIKVLHELKFAETCTATESLTELTIPQLKNLLKSKGINATGKKQELLNNIIENITEEELSSMFSLRKYRITKLGKKVIENHPEIIKKHGTKK